MPIQQMNGECLRQALHVQAAIWITGLHLRLEGPTDVLNFGITRLETIEDFDPARIVTGFFRHGSQQALSNVQEKDRIAFFHLPAARSASGNDVGVAVYAQSPMTQPTS